MILNLLFEPGQSFLQFTPHLNLINMISNILFSGDNFCKLQLLYALVEFSPVFLGVVAVDLALELAVVIFGREVLDGVRPFVGSRPFAVVLGFGQVLFGFVGVGAPFERQLPGHVVVFNAVVELFGLLPGHLHLRLALGLKVFKLLAQELVVILAFLDYLGEVVLLVLSRFLNFLSDFGLLPASPLHEVFLEGVNPRLLLQLALQFLSHLLLLLYFTPGVLSITLAKWSLSSAAKGYSTTMLLDLIFIIEYLLCLNNHNSLAHIASIYWVKTITVLQPSTQRLTSPQEPQS